MKRRLRIGLAIGVVLAIGAVWASGASAHYLFTPGANPAIITGEQIKHEAGNKITVGGSTVECKNASFEGTVTGTEVTEGSVSASYKECTATGGFAMSWDMNGCTYLLTSETGTKGHGLMHIVCPEGKQIEITIPEINCIIKIHAQTPTAGGITYTNTEGKPDDIDATVTAEGVTYERAYINEGASKTLCNLSVTPAEGNNAKLLENITIRAYKDESGKEGEQVKLTVS